MFALLAALLLPDAQAYSAGKTGSSTSGCTSCHTGGSGTTSLTLTPAKTTVAPGETVAVTLTVANTSMSYGGLDVSAGSGTLSSGSNTQKSGSEITHSGKTAMTSGSVTFNFTWTAGSAEGAVTLYAAGNAVNGNGGSSGDKPGTPISTVITVDNPCDDADSDGYTTCDNDCDDTNARINPGMSEVCDGSTDEDCDGFVDDADSGVTGTTTWYADGDLDGYGSTSTVKACVVPSGYVASGGDCNDSDENYHPSAPEACTDTVDYNCDGSIAYADADGDTFAACEECDDNNPNTYPGATEICDGLDNDCNDAVDDGAVDTSTWYEDVDGDDHGNADVTTEACFEPDGYAALSDDCNDAEGGAYPGASEIWYDGIDQDCLGGSDYDQDGDGVDSADHGGEDCFDTDPTVTDCGNADGGADGNTDGSADGGVDTAGTDGSDGVTDDNTETDDGKSGGGCSALGGSASVVGLATGLLLLGARRRRD